MDKDLLRIVIIAVGTVIVLSMILWGMLKSKKQRHETGYQHPLDNIDKNLEVKEGEEDFEVGNVRHKPRVNERSDKLAEADRSPVPPSVENKRVEEDIIEEQPLRIPEQLRVNVTPVEKKLPALINLNIVAKKNEAFTGYQLLDAFERVGLIFGSVKVFERLDEHNNVNYAVASMSENGVFDVDNWENYRCSGISFFMQPREVKQAKRVFDDMVNTLGQLTSILKGEVLDQNKELLTEATLKKIDESLL